MFTGRFRSLPRMALDLALWAGAASVAGAVGGPVPVAAAVAFIGAFPMHDLLFHGHEGAHGHLARNHRANDLASFAVHALFGLSGAGYRLFHLRHHRFAHTPRDPEYLLMARVGGAAGWSWLALPVASYAAVNLAPLAEPRHRAAVGRELAGIALLHAGLVAALGPAAWATWVVLPAVLVLGPVVSLRAVCEHHGLPPGETRSVASSPVLDFLWSNANYHAEHHLSPTTPYHLLPALRREHPPAHLSRGYLATGLRLLATRRHFDDASAG